MNHAVLMLTHNNLPLTKRAVESVRAQDVPTDIVLFDNGSTDDTVRWARSNVFLIPNRENLGVSAGWNIGINHFGNVDHVLVVNNDVVLPPWFYRELLSYDVPFVTGIAVDSMAAIQEPSQRMPLQPCPDFSAFLIRLTCWEDVGPFDERMKFYASDCDFHVRAHRLGIPLYKANVPYYHERSSTMNLASPQEREQIQNQANADREVFQSLYGCLPGTSAYEALFV